MNSRRKRAKKSLFTHRRHFGIFFLLTSLFLYLGHVFFEKAAYNQNLKVYLGRVEAKLQNDSEGIFFESGFLEGKVHQNNQQTLIQADLYQYRFSRRHKRPPSKLRVRRYFAEQIEFKGIDANPLSRSILQTLPREEVKVDGFLENEENPEDFRAFAIIGGDYTLLAHFEDEALHPIQINRYQSKIWLAPGKVNLDEFLTKAGAEADFYQFSFLLFAALFVLLSSTCLFVPFHGDFSGINWLAIFGRFLPYMMGLLLGLPLFYLHYRGFNFENSFLNFCIVWTGMCLFIWTQFPFEIERRRKILTENRSRSKFTAN